MNYADRDQLAAEIGMKLPNDPAVDEATEGCGYDPLPEFQRQAHRSPLDMCALAKKLLQLPVQPFIYPGVDS